jgi:hypothetical protein
MGREKQRKVPALVVDAHFDDNRFSQLLYPLLLVRKFKMSGSKHGDPEIYRNEPASKPQNHTREAEEI